MSTDARRDWTPQDELRYLHQCRAAALSARDQPAEQKFRATHGVQEPVEVVKQHRHLLPAGPVGDKADGSDWPIKSTLVHTVAVVAARRQIASFLAFVDVEGACKEPRNARGDCASAGGSVAVDTNEDEVRLQLVMGRQLRLHTQDDAAVRQLIKSVRPGCVLGVSGYPQRNRGAPTDADVLELICETVIILHAPPPRLPGMWPAQNGVMHEVRRHPRQRNPRGKKAREKDIEAQRSYKDRYQLDAVLTALVNELLVSQPSEPELWMAAQLADFAKSWDSVLPRVPLRHGSTLGETVELAVLHRPFKQQLIVAETGAECEAAARLMLSDLERHQREGLARGRSAVAAVGLDTEWAPPGNETVALLQLASAHFCLLLRLGMLKGDQEQLVAACGPGSSLRALLAAPEVFMAGVGVTKDAQLLADQYGFTVRGILELAPFAQQKGAGLRTLCRTVLSRELPKVHSIRCGDWLAQPLSAEQVNYAALDAEAGRQLLVALSDVDGAEPDPELLRQRCAPLSKVVLPETSSLDASAGDQVE